MSLIHDHRAGAGEAGIVMLPFPTAPCLCVVTHVPKAMVTEAHHPFPVGEQRRIFGRVVDSSTVPLCSTGHDNVHVMLRGLLAGIQPSPYSNDYLRKIAVRGYEMIKAAENIQGERSNAAT